MVRTKNISFAIVLTVLAAGCTTERMRTVAPDKPLPLDHDAGIIVGSITGVTAEHYWAISHVPYAKEDGSVTGWFESASKMTNAFWFRHSMTPGYAGPDPGLEDVLGRVFAVSLPPGKYALFPPGATYENQPVPITPAPFEVIAGVVKYIGRIQLHGCVYTPKNKRVWRGYINASYPSIRDTWEIDSVLLSRKYPDLEKQEVVISIIDDHAWRGLAPILESAIETDCTP